MFESNLWGEDNMTLREEADKIIKEAARMGFTRVLMPQRNAAKLAEKGSDIPRSIKIIGVRSLYEAISHI